jgi:hypothetical protein
MLDSNPRTRMISLRLSEGEYEILKTRFRIYGARNVSDLARIALEQIMSQSAVPQDTGAKLAELDERLNALESIVAQIVVQAKSNFPLSLPQAIAAGD